MKGIKRYYADETIEVGEFRRPEETELKGYAEWYKKEALFGVQGAGRIKLYHVNWRDIGNILPRKADGSAPGTDNSIWLISGDEYKAIMRLETERAEAANAKAKTEEVANRERINSAIAEAQVTGKLVEIARYMVDCQGGETDCSFDLCVEMVDRQGQTHRKYTHCY